MKTSRILAVAIAVSFSGALHLAAEPSSLTQLEKAHRSREQRVSLLHEELKTIDARIEGRIDVIVDALRAIGDSKDSRTKVARMKEQTIEDLKKSIRYYQTKRATLQEELRRPSLLRLTDEQKRKGIGIFDARIEKRIAQILAVQKSLPAHEDYDRYRVTGSNWTGATYAVNEDHRQNARVTSFTNSQRKEIAEGLRRSIATIEQQNRALKANQAPADEILKNDALLAERREQLASALTTAPTTTRMIGQKEALDLDKALQLAIAELRRDFTVLFTRYSTYLHELAALNQTRNALAAAQSKPS